MRMERSKVEAGNRRFSDIGEGMKETCKERFESCNKDWEIWRVE